MNLRVYLATQNLKLNDFAEMMDISRGYASALLNNKIKPSKKLCKNVEKLTNGEVKLLDECHKYDDKNQQEKS